MIQEPHMIVVDDAPDLREMLAEYLARHGFSVADAVAAARDVAGYALRSSGVTVLTALDDAPLVMADPDQLVQILVNLLVNAEQAMRGQASRRQATNAASVSDGMVHCDIGDTGPGVPAALAEQIFEPFFTTKPVGLGTGVGLSVSAGTARSGGRARAAAGRAGGGVPPVPARRGGAWPQAGCRARAAGGRPAASPAHRR
jgi:C4-dicarboxylate-specific signal transduction histidine kinase